MHFFSNGMYRIGKQQLVNQFTKSIIKQEKRKNKVGTSQITNTLINAGLNTSFVNESCKSTGHVSKSQVIYRKLNGKSLREIQECFREKTVQFLKILKIFSRNRFFMVIRLKLRIRCIFIMDV
jgi:hypothetical protein